MMQETTLSDLRQEAIDRFWETVPPVWNLVRNKLREIAWEKFEISVEQFHILRHIRRGITSASELAEVKRISRPAISQAVDALVEKGLITRQQEAGDRRFVRLALTPSGDDALNQIFHENRAWMDARIAPMSAADLDCLMHGLEALKVILEEDPE